MTIEKYKYYFKKPRSEITKDIFRWLLAISVISVASTSHYFLRNLLINYKKWRKYPKKKVSDTFYKLKHRGLIKIEEKNHQIFISLTDKGKKMAGWMQIDSLKIKKPKKWDKKWRVVMFDISELKRDRREAFRGKLKELNFSPLQKSIWITPFECRAEIELLKDFFGLTEDELRLIIAEDIGDDSNLKEIFELL